MPIAEIDIPQMAIHEASHAVIAVIEGYFVFGATIMGPEHRPGAVWRFMPPGVSAETDTNWARRELAVFAAGFTGEKIFFNEENREEWVTGACDADKPMMDYCALQSFEFPEDIQLVQGPPPVPRHRWREELPGLQWADYDNLIQQVTTNVRMRLTARRSQVDAIARMLLADGFVSGRAIFSVCAVTWNGIDRMRNWPPEEDFVDAADPVTPQPS